MSCAKAAAIGDRLSVDGNEEPSLIRLGLLRWGAMNTSRSRKDDGGYVAKLLANWTMLENMDPSIVGAKRERGTEKNALYAYFIKMVLCYETCVYVLYVSRRNTF